MKLRKRQEQIDQIKGGLGPVCNSNIKKWSYCKKSLGPKRVVGFSGVRNGIWDFLQRLQKIVSTTFPLHLLCKNQHKLYQFHILFALCTQKKGVSDLVV